LLIYIVSGGRGRAHDVPTGQLQTVGAAAQIARKQPLASESEAPLRHVLCLDFVLSTRWFGDGPADFRQHSGWCSARKGLPRERATGEETPRSAFSMPALRLLFRKTSRRSGWACKSAGMGNPGAVQIRKIARSVHESARDVARDIAKTSGYKQSRKDRKKVEMLFAHLSES